jgi:hypothetical protein
MSLFFANPLWLLGLLAAIPLLAHLFARTRPRKREFPSLVLLREAMRRVTRVRKPRDRWLLILRTLAMAALVLAFLQPWLMSKFAGGGGAAKTVVLVVDATASMGYVDGTRTRLSQATSAAEDVLATLPANSRANIVWVRAHATGALPEPGPNFEFLRQALRQATALPEPGDIAGALALALKQLNGATGERELVVLSDFQKSEWQAVKWEMPPGIRLTRVAAGADDVANVGLAGLAVEPARPVVGQEARLVCRVRNFSSEPKRATVFGEAGESRVTQAVEVAPWSETLAILPVKFPQEGLVPLKAALSEDRFPGDDVRHGLVDVRGALQVVVAGVDNDATARTWARAAQALDGVAVRRIPFAQLADVRAEVLFVAGWDGTGGDVLKAYLAGQGGALVVQPVPGFDLTKPNGLFEFAPTSPALAPEVRDAPGWALRIAAEEHPIFAIFASGAFGDPAKGKFTKRVATPTFPATMPGQALLAFEDGKPALTLMDYAIDAKGPAGLPRTVPVAWWNLDLGATDWATRTAFVPFFGEFVRNLASRSGKRAVHEFPAGESLRFEAATGLEPKDVQLLNEQEKPVKLMAEAPNTPYRLMTADVTPPGNYRWSAQGGTLDRATVNFPDTESDLRRMSEADLAVGAGEVIGESTRARLAELREGKPLWPWCLAFAAMCLLIEGLLLRAFRPKVEAGGVAGAATSSSTVKKEEVSA